MSSLDLESAPQILRFAGGDVVKANPPRESLEESLQAWASIAVLNAQIVRSEPSAVNVRGLRSSVATMERILAELDGL
jgi:hypothetical protein